VVGSAPHYSDLHPEHWEQLFQALPQQGVSGYFMSEPMCLKRLIDVRWPRGVICSACGSSNIGNIETRKPYQCKECRHQFTPISGTICHGAHLELKNWFIAAETIILANVSERARDLQTSERLRMKIGLRYKTAFALRAKLQTDLVLAGGGLIGHCICINGKSE
jgi:transposase-like protein